MKYLHCPHCQTLQKLQPPTVPLQKYASHGQRLVIAVKRKVHGISNILSNPVGIIHALNFVNRTEMFKHIYGDIKHETKRVITSDGSVTRPTSSRCR